MADTQTVCLGGVCCGLSRAKKRIALIEQLVVTDTSRAKDCHTHAGVYHSLESISV